MANSKVKFIQCSQSQYDALKSYDAGTLYYCDDTQRIYKGGHYSL